MSEEVVSYYEDFSEIEKKIWDLLTNAVTDRSSEFRTPVFICGNDKDLDGRVVVLRKADQKNSFVQYHSDIRSSKIEKIKRYKLGKKYQFLDKVFLRVLKKHPEKMPKIFFNMFKSSSNTVIKFLSNKSSILEDINIISNMPKLIFIKALFY